jgi:hypothetical protein
MGRENTRWGVVVVVAGDELLLGVRQAPRRRPLVEELGVITPRGSHLCLQ